jgi:GTPase SAR1 family protein
MEDQPALHAKAVILGDKSTGKSSLVQSFHPNYYQQQGNVEDRFNIVDIKANELNNSDMNVTLKVWEFEGKIDQIAFQGSLFCVITVDIRNNHSVESCFTKWMELKQKYMDECFLIVVGCFLDKSIARSVEIKDICRRCAECDAVYVEISNKDGTNVNLLRRIICSRIDHVRNIRREFMERDEDFEGASEIPSDIAKIAKNVSSKSHYSSDVNVSTAPIEAPFLEKDILPTSVGSILASSIGTEYWPGMVNEAESLSRIGTQISDLIGRLGNKDDQAKLPKQPLEFNLKAREVLRSEPSTEELREAFDILGFALPTSLGGEVDDSEQTQKFHMRVKLPDHSTTHFILRNTGDVMEQIDAFCASHAVKDPELKAILLDGASNAMRMIPESESGIRIENNGKSDMGERGYNMSSRHMRMQRLIDEASGGSSTQDKAEGKASMLTKPTLYKVKLRLGNGVEREAIVQRGEDPLKVAKRLARLYKLKRSEESLVLEQLSQVLKPAK